MEYSFYLKENLVQEKVPLLILEQTAPILCVLFSVQRHPEGAPSQVSPAGETLSGELVLSPGQGLGSLGRTVPCPWRRTRRRRRRRRRISTCWWERGSPWPATWTWVLRFYAFSSVCHVLWAQDHGHSTGAHTPSTPMVRIQCSSQNTPKRLRSHQLILMVLGSRQENQNYLGLFLIVGVISMMLSHDP